MSPQTFGLFPLENPRVFQRWNDPSCGYVCVLGDYPIRNFHLYGVGVHVFGRKIMEMWISPWGSFFAWSCGPSCIWRVFGHRLVERKVWESENITKCSCREVECGEKWLKSENTKKKRHERVACGLLIAFPSWNQLVTQKPLYVGHVAWPSSPFAIIG